MVYIIANLQGKKWPCTFPKSAVTTVSELSYFVTTSGLSPGILRDVAPSTDRTGEASGAGVDDNPCLVLLGVLE